MQKNIYKRRFRKGKLKTEWLFGSYWVLALPPFFSSEEIKVKLSYINFLEVWKLAASIKLSIHVHQQYKIFVLNTKVQKKKNHELLYFVAEGASPLLLCLFLSTKELINVRTNSVGTYPSIHITHHHNVNRFIIIHPWIHDSSRWYLFVSWHQESDDLLEPALTKLASFTLGLEYSPLIASLAARPLPKSVKCTPSQLSTFDPGSQRSSQPNFPGLKLYGGPPLPQHTINGHLIPEHTRMWANSDAIYETTIKLFMNVNTIIQMFWTFKDGRVIPYLVWLATKSYLMANMSVYTTVAFFSCNRISSQRWLSFLLNCRAALL